jgi:hypothetical protein
VAALSEDLWLRPINIHTWPPQVRKTYLALVSNRSRKAAAKLQRFCRKHADRIEVLDGASLASIIPRKRGRSDVSLDAHFVVGRTPQGEVTARVLLVVSANPDPHRQAIGAAVNRRESHIVLTCGKLVPQVMIDFTPGKLDDRTRDMCALRYDSFRLQREFIRIYTRDTLFYEELAGALIGLTPTAGERADTEGASSLLLDPLREGLVDIGVNALVRLREPLAKYLERAADRIPRGAPLRAMRAALLNLNDGRADS